MKRNKVLLYLSIVVGFIIYYSRYFRDNFKGNETVLYWLGFLPNFGLSFALPLIYLANRVNAKKPINHFNLVCIFTVLVMVFNEIIDKYQSNRVFDWCDIWASIVGVGCAFIAYHSLFQKKISFK
jgi:cell division protein FtsW (lipid II flippase)